MILELFFCVFFLSVSYFSFIHHGIFNTNSLFHNFFLYFRLSKNSTTYKIEFVDESVVDPVKRNASYQV